jgi:hypothetical protein
LLFNGSHLICANLLARLPPDGEVDAGRDPGSTFAKAAEAARAEASSPDPANSVLTGPGDSRERAGVRGAATGGPLEAGERRFLVPAPDPRVVFLVFVEHDDRQLGDACALGFREPVPPVVMASV